eukprot:Transcript_27306.p2 GENE.Transcript_27306~~Transcript_27306.p2  ORF type:complete len:219 (+),score=56.14 Transcript_27306:771-1427(+)
MSAVAGAAVQMPAGLQICILGLSFSLCAVLWPWIALRLVRSDRVAPAPSVVVLAAPWSLVGLAFFATGGAGDGSDRVGGPRAHAAGGWALLFLSHLGAAATLAACWRRRAILSRFARPCARGWAHPEFAAYTFPVVATSTVAVLWQHEVARAAGLGQASRAYASAVGFCSLFAVGGVVAVWLAALPRWLLGGLPPVPQLELVPVVKERECCETGAAGE